MFSYFTGIYISHVFLLENNSKLKRVYTFLILHVFYLFVEISLGLEKTPKEHGSAV